MVECFPGIVRFALQCDSSGLWGFSPPEVASPTLVIAQEAWAAKTQRDKKQAVDPEVHQLAGDVFNWDGAFCSLIPMKTLADHNCLCHSVAITAWGLQDHERVLRQAVADTMSDPSAAAQYFQDQYKKAQVERDVLDFGKEIERSPEEWTMEWERELALAQDPNMSLTEIHVFVLAHIMRRAIIVYCQAHLNDLEGAPLSPVHFGGVYLPLFLGPRALASRTPLLLAYHESHFTALVPLRRLGDSALLLPLADRHGNGLPVHYVPRAQHPPGGTAWFAMLSEWLDVAQDPTLPCLAVKVPASVDTERPASTWTERSVDPYRGLPSVTDQQRPPATTPAHLPFRSGLPPTTAVAPPTSSTLSQDRWSATPSSPHPTTPSPPLSRAPAISQQARGLSSPTATRSMHSPNHTVSQFETWRTHAATQPSRPQVLTRAAAHPTALPQSSSAFLARDQAASLSQLYEATPRPTLTPLYSGPYRLPDDLHRTRHYWPPAFQPTTTVSSLHGSPSNARYTHFS